MHAFLLSFGVIFVAELGDKSQLMAMTLASRYKPWPILAGITVATAGVHAVSVLIGAVAGKVSPDRLDHPGRRDSFPLLRGLDAAR